MIPPIPRLPNQPIQLIQLPHNIPLRNNIIKLCFRTLLQLRIKLSPDRL